MASLVKFSPIPDDSVIKLSNLICLAQLRNRGFHGLDDDTVFIKDTSLMTEFVTEVAHPIPGCEVIQVTENVPPLSVFLAYRHTKLDGSPHVLFMTNLNLSLETLASRIIKSNKSRSYKFVYDRVCVKDLVSDEFYELDYQTGSFIPSIESRVYWFPKQMQVSVSSKFFS